MLLFESPLYSRQLIQIKKIKNCQYQSYDLFVLGTRHGNDCFANLSMNHLFYMAFENSICDDYATEKFHRSLLYPVVPVVMGGANYKVEY